jgi:hypothetical protein
MLKKTLLATTLAAGLTASMSAAAGPAGIYDPRSLAMGGVGVTTATARNASFFNPAALAATKEDEDFAFNLSVAARVNDPDKLEDDIDGLETSGNLLDAEVAKFTATGGATPANAATLGPAVGDFNNQLKNVNNKALDATIFGGVILAIPSKGFGVGLHGAGTADFGAKLNYQDGTFFGQLATDITDCGNNIVASCTTAENSLNGKKDANGDLQLDSKLEVRGVMVTEVGLALAHRFNDYGGIDVGITPKSQKIKTFNQSISAQNAEIDFDKNSIETSTFNLDVGVTKTYGDSYKAGVVIKNLINKEYELANTTDKIKLERQIRLGVSHHTNWTVVGLDLDLVKNKGIQGFTQDTQFLALGAELDVWLMQVRVGYRHDLAGNYDGMASAGVALNLFGLHVDVGAATNDKEKAASVQVGLNF